MIKFFRKIRFNLIGTKETGKYFKYAIGEIVLVVIGILLALQINNWNENRKVVQDIVQTKNALKKELAKTVWTSNYFVTTGYMLGDVLQEIKTTGKIKKLVGSGSFYGEFGLFDTFVTEMTSDILDEFISLEKSLSKKDYELLELAKQLKKVMKERLIWEAKATDLSLQRFKEFSDELPWFYNNDSLSNKLRSDYISKNPIFKNKAIHYLNFQLNENVYNATEIRNNASILLWRLSNENNDMALKEFLSVLEMRNFIRSDCNTNDSIKPEFLGFRNVFIVYNNSSETAVLQKHDGNKQIIEEIVLNPNEYLNVLFYDNDNIHHGENCESIYTPVRHGFLIIEEK